MKPHIYCSSSAVRDAEFPEIAEVHRLLDAQQQALCARDPAMIEQVTAQLAVALGALRKRRPGEYDRGQARAIFARLRTHAELIARERASVDRALAIFKSSDQTYGANGSVAAGPARRHVVA
jgi:hypothetical protein